MQKYCKKYCKNVSLKKIIEQSDECKGYRI